MRSNCRETLSIVLGTAALLSCACSAKTPATPEAPKSFEERLANPALTEAGFTELFAEAVRGRFEDAKVTIIKPLEISTELPEGEARHYLGNAWEAARQDRDGRKEIIEAQLRLLTDRQASIASKGVAETRESIVPVIKAPAFLAKTEEQGGAKMLRQSLIPELWVFYAFDSPDSFNYLHEGSLQRLGLDLPALHKLSLENLRRIMPPVEKIDQGSGVFALTAGEHAASLLLLDEQWSKEEKLVDGDLIASVPSMHAALFTGSRSAEGVAALRKMTAEISGKSEKPISTGLLVRKNGQWAKYE